MRDQDKTKRQLMNELAEMRQRIAELEELDVGRKRAEETLRESERRYGAIFGNRLLMIYLNDGHGFFVDANDFALERLGYAREDLRKVSFQDIVHPEDLALVLEGMANILVKGYMERPVEVRLICRSGETIWVETFGIPLELTADRYLGLGIALDITERKQMEETLRESEDRYRLLSITDELTGLHNRRHFYEVLDTEIHRSQRYGHSFSLVMLDLDGFKEYNDKFGHASGDAVLKSLAERLRSGLRKADMAFRYGGDEFTIILPATNANRASKIVDRVRPKWLQRLRLQYRLLAKPLGFSAGIAQFPESADTADGLVFLADTALYDAKRGGGYGTRLADELGTLSTDFMNLTTLDQVYALAATVNARNSHTYGHSKRVAAIGEMIGKAVGLSQGQLADLHAASLLHDIGKVGVPDSILTKPDVLAEDERRIIENHCDEGVKVISYIKELAALVPMVRHHHEWYDGTGYPTGLKGEGIPFGARIIAVADAYDTMTTLRPYGEVMSQEGALEELMRCSGTQFDPEMVEALCRAINEATEQG